ncbi:DNA repair exonuclease [Alteribacillus sp. YIM 98480]|uniref:metallophosphoesterase family protein n=1 Tax=Alteribacillus sp. YIM 98480 TaxID=2606599 RepID=UPI00131A7CF7|nr:DNA repair exonuclease [Alteribacillus sp. YIM 98480]
MEALRFIHAADLHLGSPMPSAAGASSLLKNQLEDSIYTAVHKMVEDAIQLQVDFVILAGDLFDQENRSIKSQLFLKQKLELLQPYDITVYILFGNHDPMDKKYAPIGWPDHVEVFSTEPETKTYFKNNRPAAHLYGCSYSERSLKTNIAKTYEKKEGVPFHIGVVHGQEKNMTGSAHYAPFSLKDLEEKNMDYWALGHIHTRQYLRPHICYPGNIQARHRKEQGEKGYLLVELEKETIDVSFQAVSTVVFEKVDVMIDGHETFDSLSNTLLSQIKEMSQNSAAGLWLEVELTGNGDLSEYIQGETNIEEWKETLNEIGSSERPFFYIYEIINKTLPLSISKQINEGDHFLGDVEQAAIYYKTSPNILEKEWEELLGHPSVKKFISKPEIDFIIEEAERLVWNKWGKGESS